MANSLHSMTGFGAAQGALSDRREAMVRLSSVNGRFLEVSLKVWPRFEVEDLEIAVRRAIGSLLQRGKVQVVVDVQTTAATASGLTFCWETAEALLRELEQRPPGLDLAPISLRDLLALPGFTESGSAVLLEVDERDALLGLIRDACGRLLEAREREGRELATHLHEALAEIDGFASWLRETGEELPALLLGRLRQRLGALLEGAVVPDERLLAEAALLAERADVAEEMQRLAAHVGHFRELLAAGGAVGKKLDFLAQEMLREVNTAASKCREVGMGEQVVAAKAALERIREQLANIE